MTRSHHRPPLHPSREAESCRSRFRRAQSVRSMTVVLSSTRRVRVNRVRLRPLALVHKPRVVHPRPRRAPVQPSSLVTLEATAETL